MSNPHRLQYLRYSLGLAVLACSDSSGPNAGLEGVQFSYSGALSGRFQAVGPASNSADPRRSFAVAFVTEVGEVQVCAYEARSRGSGDFLLINVGVVTAPGAYAVPPGWTPPSTSYQPGTFLLGVDPTRTSVEHVSTFDQGRVDIEQVSATRVRGTFSVTTRMTNLSEGRFDLAIADFSDLPIICS